MQVTLCKICYLNLPESVKLEQKVIPSPSNCCSFCLGILPDTNICDEIVQLIIKELEKEGHDESQFYIALTLPLSISLRGDLLKKIFDGTFPSPKQIISRFLTRKLKQSTILRSSSDHPSALEISVWIDPPNVIKERDINFITRNFPQDFPKSQRNSMKFVPSKGKIDEIVSKMDAELAKKFDFSVVEERCTFSVSILRNPVFIGGRYQKFSRNLPQTPWTSDPDQEFVGDSENSISEKIDSILMPFFKADSNKFSASGREDRDVRMLGKGRPFCFQLINPRKTLFLQSTESRAKIFTKLEQKINSENWEIAVNSLTNVQPKQTEIINAGQEEKRKIYLASCYSKCPLTNEMFMKLKNVIPVEINQLTPIRVLKHRPLAVRKRTIFSLQFFQQDHFHFLLRLETQAGTYVKEFVHSDFGRTRPSVGELMGLTSDDVDILELDVEEISVDWPPSQQ